MQNCNDSQTNPSQSPPFFCLSDQSSSLPVATAPSSTLSLCPQAAVPIFLPLCPLRLSSARQLVQAFLLVFRYCEIICIQFIFLTSNCGGWRMSVSKSSSLPLSLPSDPQQWRLGLANIVTAEISFLSSCGPCYNTVLSACSMLSNLTPLLSTAVLLSFTGLSSFQWGIVATGILVVGLGIWCLEP